MIFHEYEYVVKIFPRFARYCLDMLENFEKSRCCPQGWLHLGQNSLTGKYELFRHGLRRFWKKKRLKMKMEQVQSGNLIFSAETTEAKMLMLIRVSG